MIFNITKSHNFYFLTLISHVPCFSRSPTYSCFVCSSGVNRETGGFSLSLTLRKEPDWAIQWLPQGVTVEQILVQFSECLSTPTLTWAIIYTGQSGAPY